MNYPSLPISAFCSTGSGGTPSRANTSGYYDGTIPWVKSGELREGIILDTEEKITELAIKESSAKLVPKGALLIAMYGATIGRIAELGVEGTTNQAICHIVPDEKVADKRYLYYGLRFRVPELIALGAGGAQPNINQQIVRDTQIPLPPLPEQKRIAAILDKADSIRRKRQEAVRLTDDLLRSVFLEMFGDPVTNPKGWEIILLGEHARKIGSGATPTGGESAYKDTGISLIRSMNVHDGEFIYKNLAYIDEVQAAKLANVKVEENDVLLNITGASVARVCRVPKNVLPARVNQHVSIIRPLPNLNPVFLEHLLFSGSVKKGLLQIGGGGATREAITKAQIEELEIICPPIDIQNMYAAQVAVIERMNDYASHATLELDNLFNSLLQRAFKRNL